MTFTLFPDTRLTLARDALAGLSVGDALGSRFFVPGGTVAPWSDALPPGPWLWSDDTEMACSVLDVLARHGRIEPDVLALAFAAHYDPARRYGAGAVELLELIRAGTPWPVAAASAFDGQGSCGNGAAMRVAPLGAWHADSARRAAEQARASAEVTHAHPEGVAGAVAVAVAASLAARARLDGDRPDPARLLTAVAGALDPAGEVHRGVRRAAALLGHSVAEAADALGNGSRVTAQDTVPFTLWVAATLLHDYPAAIRACVEAGGDVDTTAAIVGGIVAAYTGVGAAGGVPEGWLTAREPLPGWLPTPA
ncbi:MULTISPECIES: ADP-ribosylglycohydrolase family protein [unclassified Micromonospora]|uniref:ADP-ribosylglycohydrolase family protein n=1 Tax=unclassified Micromonospora TaxID=2617518 RepID=UPI001C239536|nr:MULTISPECIES: ADP-ribosylglycohydrolase family protein [unclassified Micromonospora]MBU8860030.1 ADP-ribosylglycohydrolase family protein [Micromonospora sp. WMMB482]MDM4779558.1 ADP-ribosylglycohydrolase family protein [Micromonospora sp. b486]